MRTVDARGLSCPQPVIMYTRASKEDGASPMDVIVDNAVSAENVTRAARRNGWTVTAVDVEGGVTRLELRK